AFGRTPVRDAVAVAAHGIGDDAYYVTTPPFGTALSVKQGGAYFQVRVGGFPPHQARTLERRLALELLKKVWSGAVPCGARAWYFGVGAVLRVRSYERMPSRVPAGGRRGWIIPIGGAENKENDRRILERFVRVSGGARADLVVIPTASRVHETGAR